MIVDKTKFKELEKQGGDCKLMITAYHESGLNLIKENEIGNLSIRGNGIFYDISFGKKSFISLESITGATIENGKLVITTDIEEEYKIVFRSSFAHSILKMQNLIAESIGMELITKDEVKRQVKEEKEKIITEKKAIKEEKRKEALVKYREEQKREQDRLKQLDRDHIPYCPKCHSTSITYVEHRKKLSIGRAVVGGAIAGAPGAVLGGLTSKKVKGEVKCLNCGHTWKI